MSKTITINGNQFEVPDAQEVGIVAGHTLTENEARHLFQTRCENIRNNAAAQVKKMIEAGKDMASEIAPWVAQYARDYVFSAPGVGGTRITDPVEREQYSIAKAYIKAHLAEKGRKLTDVPAGMTQEEWDAKLDANIEQVANHPDTVKLARKRVADRQKTGVSALEGVDL